MEVIDTELMLADMQVLENTLPKIQRTAKSGDKDAKLRVEIVEKCLGPPQRRPADPRRRVRLRRSMKIVAQYGFMTRQADPVCRERRRYGCAG